MRPALLIRNARRGAGLTQAELGRRMGTTQTAVARLERADSNPRLSTLDRALRAAGQELRLEGVAAAAAVDEAQISEHLRLTPAERARAHDAAYRNVRESVTSARRLDDHMG